MPRSLRNDYEGAWHHVMNRGAGPSDILARDQDRQLFIACLVLALQRYGVGLHGYCLMSTHYHLLVMSETARLSDTMRFLSGRFTRLKNLRDGRDGPLFRGRYTSVGIRSDAHLVQVSRYIHLNPVEVGLVPRAEHWKWSSAAAFLGLADKPDWLKTDFVLDMFGPAQAAAKYAQFLGAGIDQATAEFYSQLTSGHGVRPRGSDTPERIP
jgi:putative transposase